jgi:hypothetical protein
MIKAYMFVNAKFGKNNYMPYTLEDVLNNLLADVQHNVVDPIAKKVQDKYNSSPDLLESLLPTDSRQDLYDLATAELTPLIPVNPLIVTDDALEPIADDVAAGVVAVFNNQ